MEPQDQKMTSNAQKKNVQSFVESFQQAMMLKRNSKFLALLLITVAIDRIFASFMVLLTRHLLFL